MTSKRSRPSHSSGGGNGGGNSWALRRSVEDPDVISITDTEEDEEKCAAAEERDVPAFLSSSEIEVLGVAGGCNEVRQTVHRRALKRKHPQQDGGAEMSSVYGAEALASESRGPKACNSSGKEHDGLKKLLLIIWQQSDVIVAKDRQLRELQKENDSLKQRLLQCEVATNAAASSSSSPAELYIAEMVKDAVLVQPLLITRGSSVDKAAAAAETADASNDGLDVTEEPPEKPQKKSSAKEKPGKARKSRFLECSHPYFVSMGEDYVAEERREIAQILSHSEVPGWRENPLAAIYSMEGTEDIEDETFLRRHAKPELDERRRKRWDTQQQREQRKVKRLRARYEQQELSMAKKSSGKKSAAEFLPSSLLMNADCVAENLTHVEVTESLPVSAFGFQLPALPDSTFSLPWLCDGGGVPKKPK